ncbi:hypothetical protein [Streptomyces sp. NPDC051079]|uniref:hypothetical protein n=1 Tax=Streptomyces sp. NPDC051079 TaxID=3155043 RepID=UPI00344D7CD1
MAVAMVLDQDDAVRRISVGLRCPELGGLHLYIDNAYARANLVSPVGARQRV